MKIEKIIAEERIEKLTTVPNYYHYATPGNKAIQHLTKYLYYTNV